VCVGAGRRSHDQPARTASSVRPQLRTEEPRQASRPEAHVAPDQDIGAINRFRASLLETQLSRKRINNILAVLSKALRYGVLDLVAPGRAKHEENVIKRLMERVCRKAGLPEAGWHRLRHSFGTHAAAFGVNPWRLMTWMGHKRIDETMLYVQLAEQHRREIPGGILEAGGREMDPDRRILAMLGAREPSSWQRRGNEQPEKTNSPPKS
jgi:hypothetical protein